MSGVQYPNKTFVADFTRSDNIFGQSQHIIIVVADSKETATEYLYEKFRIRPDLTWLMDCNHPTIYDQTGKKPLDVQAKIMYNTSVSTSE